MAKSTISNDDKEVDESKLSRNNTVSVPKYTLAEQNPFDICNSNPSPCRPSHLVYRVKLPKITHVSEIDLGVSPKQLALKSLTRLSSKLRCIKTQSKEKLAPASQDELIHNDEIQYKN